MASNTLEIKIQALVEGLKEVAALGDQFVKTASQADDLAKSGDGFKGLGDAAKNAGTAVDKAFASLGGKSTAQIKDQINQINQALEQVKKSGAGFDEVSRASQLAEARIKALNSQLQNPAPKTFAESLGSIGSKLSALDFKGASEEANKLGSSFSDVLGVAKGMATAFLALAGLKSLGALVKDSAELAAKVETLGVTMQVVGRNAGYSAEEMTKSENALKKLGITTEVARDSLTKMIQAGIRVNEVGDSIDKAGVRMTKAQELARAAQDLAVVTGENSSDTLQRLVVNIQQMDTMGLRFMGLSVDRQSAEAKFAAQIGKTAEALSESQKKQAFFNATMSEAQKLSGAYVDALETVSKKLGSLKRFQDEFILSIGNNFVPAYGALVDAVTKYLEEGQKLADHFEKTSSTGNNLKEGMKSLADSFSAGLLNATPGVLAAMEAFSRAFRAIGDLIGPIVQGFMEFIPPVLALLTGFFDGLALIAAVIKDTVMVAFGVLTEGMGALALGFGQIIYNVGVFVSMFNKDLGNAIKEVGTSLKDTGKSLVGFGDQAVSTALSSKGAVGQFAESFNELNSAASKTKENVAAYAKEISELAKAQAEGKISAVELNSKFESLATRLEVTAKAGGLTRKEFGDLGKQLQAIPGTLVKSFEEAATGAQTSFSAITSSISKESAAGAAFMEAAVNLAGTKSKAMFEAMGTSAEKFGTDIVAAYSKFAQGAKSIEDLILLDTKLQEARKQGLITEEQVQSSLQISTKKFDELLASQLKSASTREDFDKLRESVNAMGDAGKLSGTKMTEAFDKIAEAASGASGKVKELADAQSRLSVADASVAVAQAHFNMVKAETDVMKGRVELWKAENEYAKNGNELNGLKLKSVQIGLELAKENLALTRMEYAEQIQNMTLVIAKQREINATKALEHDRNNESLQKEKMEARELAVSSELELTKMKEKVDSQREHILQIQETKLMTDAQYDSLKVIKDEQDKITKAAEEHTKAQESTRSSVEGVNTAMGNVKTSQTQVADGYKEMTSASNSWASQAVAAAVRVAKANADAANAKPYGSQADKTGKFASGNGSVTNGENGNTVNLPKDTGVKPGSGGGKDYYPDANPAGSGGPNWGRTNERAPSGLGGSDASRPQQETKAYKDLLAGYDQKSKLASQGGADTSVLGKNNMAAVDNTGPFTAWDKFTSGELDPETDKALVQGVYKAMKGNFAMMQANTNSYSFEGQADARMWMDRARQMMEKIGLPALATGTNYVPKDMIAQIHEGEAVVPKRYNPAAGAAQGLTQNKMTDWSSMHGVVSDAVAQGGLTQSIAQGKVAGGDTITKKIQVDFMAGPKKVSAVINQDDEPSLIGLLSQLKGRS